MGRQLLGGLHVVQLDPGEHAAGPVDVGDGGDGLQVGGLQLQDLVEAVQGAVHVAVLQVLGRVPLELLDLHPAQDRPVRSSWGSMGDSFRFRYAGLGGRAPG